MCISCIFLCIFVYLFLSFVYLLKARVVSDGERGARGHVLRVHLRLSFFTKYLGLEVPLADFDGGWCFEKQTRWSSRDRVHSRASTPVSTYSLSQNSTRNSGNESSSDAGCARRARLDRGRVDFRKLQIHLFHVERRRRPCRRNDSVQRTLEIPLNFGRGLRRVLWRPDTRLLRTRVPSRWGVSKTLKSQSARGGGNARASSRGARFIHLEAPVSPPSARRQSSSATTPKPSLSSVSSPLPTHRRQSVRFLSRAPKRNFQRNFRPTLAKLAQARDGYHVAHAVAENSVKIQ